MGESVGRRFALRSLAPASRLPWRRRRRLVLLVPVFCSLFGAFLSSQRGGRGGRGRATLARKERRAPALRSTSRARACRWACSSSAIAARLAARGDGGGGSSSRRLRLHARSCPSARPPLHPLLPAHPSPPQFCPARAPLALFPHPYKTNERERGKRGERFFSAPALYRPPQKARRPAVFRSFLFLFAFFCRRGEGQQIPCLHISPLYARERARHTRAHARA